MGLRYPERMVGTVLYTIYFILAVFALGLKRPARAERVKNK